MIPPCNGATRRMTMDTIIFDIDGTLTDVTHRRHYLSGAKPAWGKFFDEMVNDPPLRDVCLLAELLGDHPLVNQGAIKLFLFSGRPETHREETEEQLLKFARSYFLKAEALLMRAEGDYRADTIVKKEFLDGIKAQGYEPRLVIDDRPSVCDMWVKEGVTCLQHVNQLDQWETAKTWSPGALHMMVGPSGAGKSFYVEKQFFFKADEMFPRSALISSDALRIEIAGTLRDMSCNAQVFAAMHAMTKARIEGGLNTIIDATNLRARDRRALRDTVPQDGAIWYHVVDRPLAEKHRDAGWRDEVKIATAAGPVVKLIDKHHQSFRSGIKHIMAGDNDPRVTVFDERRIS